MPTLADHRIYTFEQRMQRNRFFKMFFEHFAATELPRDILDQLYKRPKPETLEAVMAAFLIKSGYLIDMQADMIIYLQEQGRAKRLYVDNLKALEEDLGFPLQEMLDWWNIDYSEHSN